MIEFKNKILMMGYGSVAQCTLPLLLREVSVPVENITIVDFTDKSQALKSYIDKGLKFVCEKITKENYSQILSENLNDGGLLIDLTWDIETCDIIQWCHDHNVLYVNTSVEVWDSRANLTLQSPYEKSLYLLQMKLKELSKDWQDASTAVVDHGANPGLISHFVKQGLVDIANRLIADKKVSEADEAEIKGYVENRDFAHLSKKMGVKVIHCSERDTQVTNKPKEVDEFVGTWSNDGLREEASAPAEMGWGTHEKYLPEFAAMPPVGPKNQIFLNQMGMNTWVRSWIPNEEIVGMVIRHGEAFGISDRLTVWENGEPVYRPTVHYAYMPCHETLSSLHELRCRDYKLQPKLRIMNDEITSGADILGALIMGHPYNSWWTGSILTIDETRRLISGQNATTLQVAAGIIGAVAWMIKNPRKGLNLPDDLPHDFVLDIAKPYLGEFVSTSFDWTPLKNRTVYFPLNPASQPANPDLWQFKNFLFLP